MLVSKGLPRPGSDEWRTFAPDLPLPLKVLVMVAAPESDKSARLDYESEENIVLDALSPLMRSGEVEVDFPMTAHWKASSAGSAFAIGAAFFGVCIVSG
ncbi:MAG: hypothetical protein SGI94_16390 [Saprospiraceae bacterium]|nr:hypothetical protein [Saprospiraceae bacterium]